MGIAFAFGLVILAMVAATGHLSGVHLNPAVTVAFALSRHFPARDVAAYVASQLAGGALAGLCLLLAWPQQPGNLGATVPSVGVAGALAYEIALTAILMFVIVAAATDVRAVGTGAALAIGSTVALASLVGGSVTGASLNPARSLGPALAAGEWRDFWVYVAGPLIGAALGAFAYGLVRGERAPTRDAYPERSRDGQRAVRLPA